MKNKNKIILFLLVCVVLSVFAVPVSAEAAELTASVTLSTGEWAGSLTDGKESTYYTVPAGGSITVEAEGTAALYVKFHLEAKPWTASFDGGERPFGTNGFLHEYAKLPSANGRVTMTFPEATSVAEIRVFGEGEPPNDVQVWEKSFDKADVLLLSSHSDDEQLFFAGLIPLCAASDIDLQVVYFCEHNDNPIRLHEQLNGLWAAGATHYPVIGRYPDLYSEGMDWALNAFGEYGYTRDDFVAYQCEMIRRFKPEIVVGHDIEGEYGHGTHILNTSTLMEALELTGDPEKYKESAELYGTWDVPKTYIHLWKERPIVMNYDEPLDYFGGKTAYQMSVSGYRNHNSQQWTWFTEWLVGTGENPITAASQITYYSPCMFGLYRTTVGDDVNGDMFENVTLRKDIPPETEPPETSGPDDPPDVGTNGSTGGDTGGSETESVRETEEPRTDSPDDRKTLQIDSVFLIVAAAVVICGGICAVIMMKRG